jgi:hypothetical protein
MGKRGPKSASSLTISAATPLETIQRPDAPYDLTDEETEEWWAVVNRMPADWFPRETHGLLSQYCRHVVRARRISQLIAAEEKDDTFSVDRYDKLLNMQTRESRILSSLATRMRISQQASFDKEKKKGKQAQKPWEFTGSR